MERRAEDVVEVLVTLGSKVTNRFNNVDFTVIREQAERRESVRARERKGNKRGACLQLTQTWARSRILSPWADRREKERSQQAGKSEHQGASNLPSSKLLAKASLRLEGEPDLYPSVLDSSREVGDQTSRLNWRKNDTSSRVGSDSTTSVCSVGSGTGVGLSQVEIEPI